MTFEYARRCNTSCGDGVRWGQEECDDGNTHSGDGCSEDCTTEEDFNCSQIVLLDFAVSVTAQHDTAEAPAECVRDVCSLRNPVMSELTRGAEYRSCRVSLMIRYSGPDTV